MYFLGGGEGRYVALHSFFLQLPSLILKVGKDG